MTDPEIEYQRIVSGDAGVLRALAETLANRGTALATVRTDLADAASVPVWSGSAAGAFVTRAHALGQGVAVSRATVVRAGGALEAAAAAYDTAVVRADFYIAFWRNRPAGLPPVVEELFARVVNARLLAVGTSYNSQLAGIAAALGGEEVDLDKLDQETREWVERGLDKNRAWLDGNRSGLGPLIPNTAAMGDGRNLIPQGLGYDAATGTLLQSYDDHDKGDRSTMALIDEVTGQEIGEVQLGDTFPGPDGNPVPSSRPGHVGGVTVDGDNVYVTDKGRVYTYSLSEMRNASSGQPVQQSAPPADVSGGSYSAFKDGKLYVGDFHNNVLYVHEKNAAGDWVEVDAVDTPDECQGVMVRDGEYVFSSSYGRDNEGQLIVQDRETGDRSDPFTLPTMSEGVVEVDGELVVTYESGAEEYDHVERELLGKLWGFPDSDGLWANPYMTPDTSRGARTHRGLRGGARDPAQRGARPGGTGHGAGWLGLDPRWCARASAPARRGAGGVRPEQVGQPAGRGGCRQPADGVVGRAARR
ncbi:MAG: hypothetical protein H0X12_07760 [Nocardioides sp.]|nr:hypothetical protein [Nocardioides sp.]